MRMGPEMPCLCAQEQSHHKPKCLAHIHAQLSMDGTVAYVWRQSSQCQESKLEGRLAGAL